MTNILTHDPVRELSVYRDGFNAGRDVGLRLALDVIVAGGYNQEERPPHQPANSSQRALRVGAAGGGRPGSRQVPAADAMTVSTMLPCPHPADS